MRGRAESLARRGQTRGRRASVFLLLSFLPPYPFSFFSCDFFGVFQVLKESLAFRDKAIVEPLLPCLVECLIKLFPAQLEQTPMFNEVVAQVFLELENLALSPGREDTERLLVLLHCEHCVHLPNFASLRNTIFPAVLPICAAAFPVYGSGADSTLQASHALFDSVCRPRTLCGARADAALL